MERNDIIKIESGLYRILSIDIDRVLAIDCIKRTMPKFYPATYFEDGEKIDCLNGDFLPLEDLSPNERKKAQERFTMIANAVSVVDEPQQRSLMIEKSAMQFGMSKQSIRAFLCSYLVYQDVAVLAPRRSKEKELTKDQRNIRYGLNKFFYTRNQNSLPTAYAMMLKEKYCDEYGVLLPEYPSYNQFRYYYRKWRKLEKFYISRMGLKDYQKNKRCLVGDGVQALAPSIGTAMLDSTICDVYLVNDNGQLIGRPILTVACDANTSMCLGYSLLLENNTASLLQLMLNILEDKVSLCERMGIHITAEQWAVDSLPRLMITDGGAEYNGYFDQISELGVVLEKVEPFRGDQKGPVEKFFDLVQSAYKVSLMGKGTIMPDFQERGSHDYRKDAVLSLREFEKIVVKTIIHMNCERVLKNYPYTAEMLADSELQPYAYSVWNWKKQNEARANLIDVSKKDLVLTLLPRTKGKFTRYGLKVNRLRYYADGYKEQFLQGGDAVVAYNPDNCNKVWVKEKDGSFVEFSLIEQRFSDMSLDKVQDVQRQQKELIQSATRESYQAKIDLMSFIETVTSTANSTDDVQIKNIRSARQKERRKQHKDVGGVIDE